MSPEKYLDNLIEEAKKKDQEEKERLISIGKAGNIGGEDFWTHSLKVLKDLITNEKQPNKQ